MSFKLTVIKNDAILIADTVFEKVNCPLRQENKMDITFDKQAITWTLIPSDDYDEGVFSQMVNRSVKGSWWQYDGQVEENHGGRVRRALKFRFEDCRLVLRGSDLGLIRDFCFFLSGGLTFVDKLEVGGRTGAVVTVRLCKTCGKQLLTFLESWPGICKDCK